MGSRTHNGNVTRMTKDELEKRLKKQDEDINTLKKLVMQLRQIVKKQDVRIIRQGVASRKSQADIEKIQYTLRRQ